MVYHCHQIAKIVKANKLRKGHNELITGICYDTRKLFKTQGTLFVALSSSFDDGHTYIKQAYELGIRSFLLNREFDLANTNQIVVENTLEALQTLAEHHRKMIKGKVVAITGSNGKTTIKEWLYQLLAPSLKIYRSPGSYNSQLGVALSILEIDTEQNYDYLLIEAGISKPNEMVKLEKMIKPNFGILSNIGTAHLANYKNQDELAQEKIKLFKNVKTWFAPYQYIKEFKNKIQWPIGGIFWSTDKKQKTDYNFTLKKDKGRTQVYESKKMILTLPFELDAMISNALTALCFLQHQEISSKALDLFQHLAPLSLRLEKTQGIEQCTIIKDYYNNDLFSLQQALDYQSKNAGNQEKTIILSDFSEEKLKHKDYELLVDWFKFHNIKRLILVGKQLSQNLKLPQNIDKSSFETTNELIENIKNIKFSDECILIKGSRNFEFEKIEQLLNIKRHQTFLQVDLKVLEDNFKTFKKMIPKETKILAMIKASAYGSGAAEVAKILSYHKIDFLGVAYLDEGIELRKNGMKTRILVMNAFHAPLNLLEEYCLEPVISNLTQLKQIKAQRLTLHLEINTGMQRLGFEEQQLKDVINYINNETLCKVGSVFSHMPVADEPFMKKHNLSQISQFKKIATETEEILGYSVIKHLANTAATTQFREAYFDMVRLGIGLHGYDPLNKIELKPTASLKTHIIELRTVQPNEGIGYGLTDKSNKKREIAVLEIGYADGLNRLLGNGNWLFRVNQKSVLSVGKICMDLCMIDVTKVSCQVGDEVEVFGNHHTFIEMAKICNTIPYEILTCISSRVRRIYSYEN